MAERQIDLVVTDIVGKYAGNGDLFYNISWQPPGMQYPYTAQAFDQDIVGSIQQGAFQVGDRVVMLVNEEKSPSGKGMRRTVTSITLNDGGMIGQPPQAPPPPQRQAPPPPPQRPAQPRPAGPQPQGQRPSPFESKDISIQRQSALKFGAEHSKDWPNIVEERFGGNPTMATFALAKQAAEFFETGEIPQGLLREFMAGSPEQAKTLHEHLQQNPDGPVPDDLPF